MTVNGSPIDSYILKPSAATITYSLEFEEQQARSNAGLTYDEYEALPGTPMWIDPQKNTWSKCHYIMWYRMSERIPAVAQDAQIRANDRKRNRKF